MSLALRVKTARHQRSLAKRKKTRKLHLESNRLNQLKQVAEGYLVAKEQEKNTVEALKSKEKMKQS